MTKSTVWIKNTSSATMTVTKNTFNKVTTPVQWLYTASWNIWLADTSVWNVIKLIISWDYYKENPKIEILADSKTLSWNILVTANYWSWSWQELSFTSSTLPTTLEIWLLNPYFSTSWVRNIHIKSLTINGKNVSLSSAQYKTPTLTVDSDWTIWFLWALRLYFSSLK
jgi:hypothetical protein